MAHSSILGADVAARQPSGRGADVLGPSDNSDSGSDAMGTDELHEDSDAAGTGERGAVVGSDAREGGDILPDRVTRLPEGDGFPEADPDSEELADVDSEDKGDEESERRRR
jgi:hypothetical protein